jgi:hypothetical protein
MSDPSERILTEEMVDSDLLLVQGLDYSSVFENCPFAIGVAALDGRVIFITYHVSK